MKSKSMFVRFAKAFAGIAAVAIAILVGVNALFAPVTVMASSETGTCLFAIDNKTGEKIPCDQALAMRHDIKKDSFAHMETVVVHFPNGGAETICKKNYNEAGEEIPCPAAKMPEPFR